jgi:hypothetical protein
MTIIIVAKNNTLPLVIIGVVGLGIVGWLVYKMFESSKKDDTPKTPVPICTPVLPLHATPRVVDTTGTAPSAAHKARYLNQYLRRNKF